MTLQLVTFHYIDILICGHDLLAEVQSEMAIIFSESIIQTFPRLRAGRSRVQIPVRARDFSLFQKHPDQLWGLPSLLFDGCWCSFLE